jgi:amino-acid N-acetyltransferase
VKLTDLRGILQYIPQFREKTFVLSVDGGIVTDENFANILLDVAVLRSLSIRVVLVHGASAQIKALRKNGAFKPSDLDGAGITRCANASGSLDGRQSVTHEILEVCRPMTFARSCANAIIAHPMGIIQGVDHLLTGKVERVDVESFSDTT